MDVERDAKFGYIQKATPAGQGETQDLYWEVFCYFDRARVIWENGTSTEMMLHQIVEKSMNFPNGWCRRAQAVVDGGPAQGRIGQHAGRAR